MPSPSNPVLVDKRDRQPIRPIGIQAHDGRAIGYSELMWVDRSQLGHGASDDCCAEKVTPLAPAAGS